MLKSMESRKGSEKRARRLLTVLLLGTLPVLSGCSQPREDSDGVIVVEQEAEPVVYDMAAVTRGDVQKTQRIKCTYRQVNDESLSFGISGISVKKVYVQEGDTVEKGQVLAELASGSMF